MCGYFQFYPREQSVKEKGGRASRHEGDTSSYGELRQLTACRIVFAETILSIHTSRAVNVILR